MPKDPNPTVKIEQNPPSKVISEQLEKVITAALTKLKRIWHHENALTGIQFYGDLED
jgi:hypothetical protein